MATNTKNIFIKVQADVNRATKDLKALNSGIEATKRKIDKKVAAMKALNKSSRTYAATLGKAKADIARWNSQISAAKRKADALRSSMGQLNSNTGKVKRAFRGLPSAIRSVAAQFIAIGLAIRGIRNTVKVVVDFDKAVTDLAAVMGRGRDEMGRLSESAKDLGSTTAKTATEVAMLQKELAKLGFTETEILNSTKAIIDLSVATGTDLARATEVAGTTLRAFRLSSYEMINVVDTMTKSFSSSALDMEKFAESMKHVAPIAASTNVDLETTTALLGQLANVGISGSIAGTQMRRVLLEMGTEGSKMTKALGFTVKTSEDLMRAFTSLRSAGLDLADAEDLVGKRAMASLLALTELSGESLRLQRNLENAKDTAAEMAETQLTSLSGKTTLLKSAWQGFVLSIDEGTGVMSTAFGSVIENLTEMLQRWQGAEGMMKAQGKALGQEMFKEFIPSLRSIDRLFADGEMDKGMGRLKSKTKEAADKTKELQRAVRFARLEYEKIYDASIIRTDRQDEAEKRLNDAIKAAAAQEEFTDALRDQIEVRERDILLDQWKEKHKGFLNTQIAKANKKLEAGLDLSAEDNRRASVANQILKERVEKQADLNREAAEAAERRAKEREKERNQSLKQLQQEKDALDKILTGLRERKFIEGSLDSQGFDDLSEPGQKRAESIAELEWWYSEQKRLAKEHEAEMTTIGLTPEEKIEKERVQLEMQQALRAEYRARRAEIEGTYAEEDGERKSQAYAESILNEQLSLDTKEQMLLDYYERGLINEDDYQKSLAEIQKRGMEVRKQLQAADVALARATASAIGQVGQVMISDQEDRDKALADIAKRFLIQQVTRALTSALTQIATQAFSEYSSVATYGAAGAAKYAAMSAQLMSVIRGAGWSGAQGFAEGGYTGPGGKYKEAGVVHAGEVVFSQEDVKRLGGWKAVDAIRPTNKQSKGGGYFDGGVVRPTADTRNVDAQEAQLEAISQMEIYTRVTDINEGQERVAEIVEAAELGGTPGRVGHFKRGTALVN